MRDRRSGIRIRACLDPGLPALALLVAACASAAQEGSLVVPPELLARAGAGRPVRVIVRLRHDPAAQDPSAAIAAAQQAVLRAIQSTPHRVLRVYQTVPLLALEASAGTLRVLAALPDVARVEEDALAAPQ